jgi:hypothetical protein
MKRRDHLALPRMLSIRLAVEAYVQVAPFDANTSTTNDVS